MTLETHGPRMGTKDAMQQGRGEGGLCQSKKYITDIGERGGNTSLKISRAETG